MADPTIPESTEARKPKGTTHLAGAPGKTACGKSVAVKDEGFTFYSDRRPRTARTTPLRTTTVFDEVTCTTCQRGYEYRAEMRERKREALEARRTRTYRLSVSVEITAADNDDAYNQMCRLFSSRIRDKVSVEEVAR